MGTETMKRFTCDCCGTTVETHEHVYAPENWVNMSLQTLASQGCSGPIRAKDVWVCSRACLIGALNRIASDLEKPKRKATTKAKKKAKRR